MPEPQKSLEDLFLECSRLPAETAEQTELREALVMVTKDLQRIDMALMRIVDTGQRLPEAFVEVSDPLVTHGYGLFGKMAGCTNA